jgi:PKD repeat protein
MTKLALSSRRLGLKLFVMALLALPELAGAQFFQYNQYGDVLAGFRKTGSSDTTGNEMVSDFGSVTNFLIMPAGTTFTVTNFTAGQLTDSVGNYNNLQWSAFSSFIPGNNITSPYWQTPLGRFPNMTIWLTLPATNVSVQTTPPIPATANSQANQYVLMNGVGSGARQISADLPESVDNTNTVVREPKTSSYAPYGLTAQIGDVNNTAYGDFGGNGVPLGYTVENTTPASFSGSQRDDFYQLVPSGKTDPITGSTDAVSYLVGYFLLNSSGSMTFTRAFGITSSATNGNPPLKVVFSTTATNNTGALTNWVWNFGNGTIITNTTGRNVTNTYAAAGNFTVTLTVYGPGGSGVTSFSYIVVTSLAQPLLSIAQSGSQFVLSGINGPASQQYRILTSSNLLTALASWKPIYTNTVRGDGTFGYTNTIGGTNSFFIMTSP